MNVVMYLFNVQHLLNKSRSLKYSLNECNNLLEVSTPLSNNVTQTVTKYLHRICYISK